MKNIAASIRAKLLNMARKEQVPFQRILTLYKQEGILHRIVMTKYGKSIVLKGGLFFYQLQGIVARPTKDIDLLGSEDSGSESSLREILIAASKTSIDGGLRFDHTTIQIEPIAGQTEHGGVKGSITGYLDSARTHLQIDMGFGDVITGGPVNRPYRTLLGNRSFSIQTYSDETIAAEKLETVVSLGTVNSRYKDLFDLFELLIVTELPEDKVIEAAVNTFKNRGTTLPENPESLSDAYRTSPAFATEWSRYLRRIEVSSPDLDLLRKELFPRLRRIYRAIRDQIDQQVIG